MMEPWLQACTALHCTALCTSELSNVGWSSGTGAPFTGWRWCSLQPSSSGWC